jgi:hypothetical protein
MCALKLNPVSEVNTNRDLFFQGKVVDEPPMEVILRILNYLNDRDLAKMREAGWRWNHCIINFPAFCTRLIARECIFVAKQLAVKHLQLTAPMEDHREQQGLMRVIRLEAQVDPERAKKTAAFFEIPYSRGRALVEIVGREALQNLSNARITASGIEPQLLVAAVVQERPIDTGFFLDSAKLAIAKVEATQNIITAKTSVASITNLLMRTEGFLAIAEADPTHDLTETAVCMNEVENHHPQILSDITVRTRYAMICLKFAQLHPEHDFTKAQLYAHNLLWDKNKVVESIALAKIPYYLNAAIEILYRRERVELDPYNKDSYSPERLVEFVKLTAQKNLPIAATIAESFTDHLTRALAFIEIAKIDPSYLKKVYENMKNIANPDQFVIAILELYKMYPQNAGLIHEAKEFSGWGQVLKERWWNDGDRAILVEKIAKIIEKPPAHCSSYWSDYLRYSVSREPMSKQLQLDACLQIAAVQPTLENLKGVRTLAVNMPSPKDSELSNSNRESNKVIALCRVAAIALKKE